LAEAARAAGLFAMEGWLIPTARNVPVRDLYERHGFTVVETREEEMKWRLDLGEAEIAAPVWIKLVEETRE